MVSEWSLQEVKELRKLSSKLRVIIPFYAIGKLKFNIKYKYGEHEINVLEFSTAKETLDDAMLAVENFIRDFVTEVDLMWKDKPFTSLELVVINKSFSLLTIGVKERYYTRQKSIKLNHTQKLSSMPFLKTV